MTELWIAGHKLVKSDDVWAGTVPAQEVWYGGEKLWSRLVLQDPVTTVFTAQGMSTYTPPEWWREGIDFLDIMCLGGGGGGAQYNGGYGNGKAGTWATATTQERLRSPSGVTVGGGGSGVAFGAGGDGGLSYVRLDNTTYLARASGGAGGPSSFGEQTRHRNNAPSKTYQGLTIDPSPYNSSYRGRGGMGAVAFGTGEDGVSGLVVVTARQNTAVN